MTQALATQQVYSAEVQALIDSQDDALAAAGGKTPAPIVKLTQSMTPEVKDGDVEAGEFFNTLTSESYGDKIELIICTFAEGRAMSGKGGAYVTAIGQERIPEHWADVIGEENVGLRFDEHPDAHERYSERANAKEIEWGSGPSISSTYNYTGLVVVTDPETDAEALFPVRLTLQRTTKEAHSKISTIKTNLLRNKPFWDITFDLESYEKTSGRNTYFGIKVKKGRNTTTEERERALELVQAALTGNVTDNSQESKAPREKVADDGTGLGL